MRMSSVIVKPIASPAIDLNVPLGSTAVAKITQTRKKVRIASTATPAPTVITGVSDGAPSLVPFTATVGKIHFRSSAAITAAPNCTTQ